MRYSPENEAGLLLSEVPRKHQVQEESGILSAQWQARRQTEGEEVKRLNKAKAAGIVAKVAKTLIGEDNPNQCEIDKAVGALNSYTGTAKSGKAILEEMRTAVAIDPIESLFHGINFRQQGDRLDAIQRTRIYCAGAEKRAIDRIIEDRRERIEDLRRQMKMANAQIERLERAIHQISTNRASEVVRACQEPYGCAEAVGLAPKEKWTARFTEGC